jgi:hypothetical protein
MLWMKGIVVRMPAAFRLVLGPSQPYARTQWVTGTLLLLVERPGREADHCFPFSVDLKNAWSFTSIALYTCFESCGQGILIRYYNTIVIAVIVIRIWKIPRCNTPYWAADSGPPVLKIPLPIWKSKGFFAVFTTTHHGIVFLASWILFVPSDTNVCLVPIYS